MNYISTIFKKFPIPYRYLLIGAIIGFWIDLLQNFAFHLSMRNDYNFSWLIVSSRFFAFYLVWIFLSPFIYQVALRYSNIFRPGHQKELWQWIGLSMGISLIHLLLYSLVFDLLIFLKNGVFANWLEVRMLIRIGANYFASLVYYLLIIAIFFFHIYLVRFLNKEKELNKAQLNALLMQLRPHFIFNTLHSINTLIDLDGKAAQRMVTKLGQLLRQVIQNDQGHLITLEEELQFVKNYLDIEQVRFQDRLQVQYELDAESLEAKVPKLILQPIVENTIKHGISKLTDHGLIRIRSAVNTDSDSNAILLISIQDNGPGIPSVDTAANSKGIGLKNVDSRLKQHYGDNYVFTIEPTTFTGGAHVRIKIPFSTK